LRVATYSALSLHARAPVGVDNGPFWSEESVSAISGVNDTQNAELFVFHLATEHPEELEVMGFINNRRLRRLTGNFVKGEPL